MSKPEVKSKIGGYDLEWTQEKIQISVTRIKLHRDNRITGWLMIKSIKNGGAGLIHQGELNFASSQTQKQLVNILQDKNSKVEWDSIIEQLRYYVLEKAREGEPILHLSTEDEDIKPPNYLVYPVLPESQPTVIFGDPGVAKTNTALLIYITMILPWYDNPLGLDAPDRSIKALFLDYESDYKLIRWRLKCIKEGMGLPPVDLEYRRCVVPLADDLEQIQNHMASIGAEAMVIDSLAQAAGGKFLEGDVATNFFQALRQIKATPLIIAQNEKDPEKKAKTILGSGIYQYYSRSIWELKKAQHVGADKLHVALHHRKSNESKLFRPMTYEFYFNENKTTITQQYIGDVPEFRESMKPREKVLMTLKELGRAGYTMIAEAANISESATQVALSRLKKDNKVINFREDNTWGLITRELGE